MRDFDHSLPMLLLRAREATMAQFRPVLGNHGLTEQQWRVLRVLREHNDIETKELSERALILQPSMTGMIDRLERDGLVERRKDRRDGRRTAVRMTRRGKRLYERMAPLLERQYAKMQSRFSGSQWNGLYDSLQRLVNLNGTEPPASKG